MFATFLCCTQRESAHIIVALCAHFGNLLRRVRAEDEVLDVSCGWWYHYSQNAFPRAVHLQVLPMGLEEFIPRTHLGHRKQVWTPCTERQPRYEFHGSLPEANFMDQAQSAWRPKLAEKTTCCQNASDLYFGQATRDISAIPTDPGGSRGPVQSSKT